MPYADIAATRLFFSERGDGPLALFVHGYPLDGTVWLDQLEALADRRRCLAVDLRGFGRSEATNLPVLSMERHADDMAALLAALGTDQADIVGLSMGGYVALALAERHPEVIRSLALIDTRAAADDEAGRTKRREAAARVVGKGGRLELAEGMLTALLAADTGPFVRGRLRTMIEGTRYETIVAALEGMAERPDRSRLLGGIEVATAVIVGEEDGLIPPAEAEAMAHAIPGATFHLIAGAGHLTPIERPEAVSTALTELFERVDG